MWLDGCPAIGAHLHILWDTPNRQQSHPRAACRLLGLGTDSVCSHTEFLVANCRSSHEHSARSYHQPYCVGIYSDLTKTNRHHHYHCWSSHGNENKDCSCLGCDDMQSHRNLTTFHTGLSPQSSRQLNNDGVRWIPLKHQFTSAIICITSTRQIPSNCCTQALYMLFIYYTDNKRNLRFYVIQQWWFAAVVIVIKKWRCSSEVPRWEKYKLSDNNFNWTKWKQILTGLNENKF